MLLKGIDKGVHLTHVLEFSCMTCIGIYEGYFFEYDMKWNFLVDNCGASTKNKPMEMFCFQGAII